MRATQPEQPLRFSYKRLVLLAGRGARAFAAIADLTPQRAELLHRLYFGPLHIRALAFDLGVHPSVVSRMVKALLDLGLVVREKDPKDRRRKLVFLTPAGEKRIDKLYDGWMPDEPHACIQEYAEWRLVDDWRAELAEHTAIGTIEGVVDHRPIARDVFEHTVRRDYWREWGITPPKKDWSKVAAGFA